MDQPAAPLHQFPARTTFEDTALFRACLGKRLGSPSIPKHSLYYAVLTQYLNNETEGKPNTFSLDHYASRAFTKKVAEVRRLVRKYLLQQLCAEAQQDGGCKPWTQFLLQEFNQLHAAGALPSMPRALTEDDTALLLSYVDSIMADNSTLHGSMVQLLALERVLLIRVILFSPCNDPDMHFQLPLPLHHVPVEELDDEGRTEVLVAIGCVDFLRDIPKAEQAVPRGIMNQFVVVGYPQLDTEPQAPVVQDPLNVGSRQQRSAAHRRKALPPAVTSEPAGNTAASCSSSAVARTTAAAATGASPAAATEAPAAAVTRTPDLDPDINSKPDCHTNRRLGYTISL